MKTTNGRGTHAMDAANPSSSRSWRYQEVSRVAGLDLGLSKEYEGRCGVSTAGACRDGLYEAGRTWRGTAESGLPDAVLSKCPSAATSVTPRNSFDLLSATGEASDIMLPRDSA